MIHIRRMIVRVLAVGMVVLACSISLADPASAGCTFGSCPDGGTAPPPSGSDSSSSSATQVEQYSSPPSAPTEPAISCSVYANGAGMGSYCVSAGDDSSLKTLRERFGNQSLQRCRYRPIPQGIETPFNSREGDGRYMVLTCLGNIDFDTITGGTDRTLDMSVVFVENGTDTSDHHNGITDYLWRQFESSSQLPVPFMRTRPSIVPVVGVPTFFTFRWLDPATNNVVAEGPFAGDTDGGPYREIRSNGLLMRAEATGITVDPNQQGIASVNCRPDTPYREGVSPANQPEGACDINFPRSSASARKYATEPIPGNVKDAFNVSVQVEWKITYGRGGGDMQDLGNGFTMRLKQVLPVQEIQVPNQPPTVTY